MKGSLLTSAALLFFAATPAMGHPVDKERENFCGVDDPNFHQAWRAFWHCKRELEDLTIDYSACVGEVRAMRRHLGWPDYSGNKDVLDYFDVAPADPITEEPGDLENAAAHLQACESTTILFSVERGMCEYYRVEADSALTASVRSLTAAANKPAQVICCDKRKRNCKPC